MLRIAFCVLMLINFGRGLELGPSLSVCGGTISKVDVTPCTSEPCSFNRGQTVSVVADFVSNHNVPSSPTSCVLELKVNIEGIWYDISEDPDICSPSVLQCPLVTGNTHTLNYGLVVGNDLPPGLSTTQWTLLCNGGADEIFCARIDVNIQN